MFRYHDGNENVTKFNLQEYTGQKYNGDEGKSPYKNNIQV